MRNVSQRLQWALLLVLTIVVPVSAQDNITISGTISTRSDGRGVGDAVVSIVGTSQTASTDSSGRYTIIVPASTASRERIQLKIEALGLPAKVVEVTIDRPNLTVDVALTLNFTEELTIGSRVAGAGEEKAVPVDVITHEQIAASGYAETAQVIDSLAPSFNFPRPTITDGTDTVRPATLRGLGPDQVLVLVNGKRRHQSALVHLNGSIGRGSTGVDLNAIPVSAIDHIEVLRDGAAAQYGSDAIAGVINIVLEGRRAAPGGDLELRPLEGQLRRQQLHVQRADVREGDDINFSDGGLADVGGSWGMPPAKAALTVAAEYRHHNRTNRASFDPRDQIVAGDAGNNAVASRITAGAIPTRATS